MGTASGNIKKSLFMPTIVAVILSNVCLSTTQSTISPGTFNTSTQSSNSPEGNSSDAFNTSTQSSNSPEGNSSDAFNTSTQPSYSPDDNPPDAFNTSTQSSNSPEGNSSDAFNTSTQPSYSPDDNPSDAFNASTQSSYSPEGNSSDAYNTSTQPSYSPDDNPSDAFNASTQSSYSPEGNSSDAFNTSMRSTYSPKGNSPDAFNTSPQSSYSPEGNSDVVNTSMRSSYSPEGNSPDAFNTSTQSSYSSDGRSSNAFNTTTHSIERETPEIRTHATMDYYDSYYYDYGDKYIYPAYSFERPVYLYIWTILAILTFLVNVIVVSVLLRRKMRSSTNLILAAIAISDTLTGLITLPTYIMVYKNYDPYDYSYYMNDDNNIANKTINTTILTSYPDTIDMLSIQELESSTLSDRNQNMYFVSSNTAYDGTTESYNFTKDTPYYDPPATQPPLDGYILTEDLCRGFMISKYFLSKIFHTVSIFLTLLLGIQRYVSVAFPLKVKSIFTVNKTIIFSVIIFFASPVLHLYHLTGDKTVGRECQWDLGEEGCGGDCIYLWILFLVRHLIPCVSLTTFTILFIKHLRLGATNLRRMDSNPSQLSKRIEENRRISIIVAAIVIVFLIPEIPYGAFLLYSAFEKTVNDGKGFRLEVNRAIHTGYELLLALSFNANFYIYTLVNKTFRKCLYRTYIKPMQRCVRVTRSLSVSRTFSMSYRATRRTDCGTSQGELERKVTQTSSSDKSVTIETQLKQSLYPGVSKSSSNADSNELLALNVNL